ncbi:hypothetical protein, partial [Corynebacterium sp.]|uniref:hypothetical protein n=1 Tax=Corynebacterium sp. TaxID=1720 RepID=UPI00257A25B5
MLSILPCCSGWAIPSIRAARQPPAGCPRAARSATMGGTAPGLPAKLLPSLREHAAHLVGGLFTFVGFD